MQWAVQRRIDPNDPDEDRPRKRSDLELSCTLFLISSHTVGVGGVNNSRFPGHLVLLSSRCWGWRQTERV
jgi:hypothetical protein